VPRVAVVADSPIVRAGILALLGAEPTLVVIDAVTPAEPRDDDSPPLRELVASAAPDVVVWAPWRLDDDALFSLHDDPAERDSPRIAVVLLADLGGDGLAVRALRAGVAALLPADADGPEIAAAVHAAAAGLIAFPGSLARELIGAASAATAATLPAQREPAGVALTPREREVLVLLAEGLPNKAIAPRLDITEHTVKAHVAAIYHKLGAGNRAEAVVAAARQGLILL
jgi:DNA-binding NarL/FixJ family response regulator